MDCDSATSDPIVWTNTRVIEWVQNIDLEVIIMYQLKLPTILASRTCFKQTSNSLEFKLGSWKLEFIKFFILGQVLE